MKIRWFWLDGSALPAPPGREIATEQDEIRAAMGAREGTVLWLGPPIETPHEAAFRVVGGL